MLIVEIIGAIFIVLVLCPILAGGRVASH